MSIFHVKKKIVEDPKKYLDKGIKVLYARNR